MRNTHISIAYFLLLSLASCKDELKIFHPNSFSNNNHLQGIATDGEYIYWSFSKEITKTKLSGEFVDELVLYRDSTYHHFGDLTIKDNKLYIATEEDTRDWGSKSRIYILDIDSFQKRQVIEIDLYNSEYSNNSGAGAMTFANGKFYVTGYFDDNEIIYVTEFDENFRRIRQIDTKIKDVKLGIQTINYINGLFWIGCYELNKNALHLYDDNWEEVDVTNFKVHYGVTQLNDIEILVGDIERQEKQSSAYVIKKKFPTIDY